MTTKELSPNGIAILQKLEGVRYKPYLDSGGKWTVGVGHLIVPGDGCNTTDPIDGNKVAALLKKDVQESEACVNKNVTSNLTQNQFDALVIFVFNIGITAFKNSTLLRLLNESRYQEASLQFARWNKINAVSSVGLANRRLAEKILFLTT
jgi:lysozyme